MHNLSNRGILGPMACNRPSKSPSNNSVTIWKCPGCVQKEEKGGEGEAEGVNDCGKEGIEEVPRCKLP